MASAFNMPPLEDSREISSAAFIARAIDATGGFAALLCIHSDGAGEFLRRDATQSSDFTRDHCHTARTLWIESSCAHPLCKLDAFSGEGRFRLLHCVQLSGRTAPVVTSQKHFADDCNSDDPNLADCCTSRRMESKLEEAFGGTLYRSEQL